MSYATSIIAMPSITTKFALKYTDLLEPGTKSVVERNDGLRLCSFTTIAKEGSCFQLQSIF